MWQFGDEGDAADVKIDIITGDECRGQLLLRISWPSTPAVAHHPVVLFIS